VRREDRDGDMGIADGVRLRGREGEVEGSYCSCISILSKAVWRDIYWYDCPKHKIRWPAM